MATQQGLQMPGGYIGQQASNIGAIGYDPSQERAVASRLATAQGPVDVSAITKAASSEAARNFADLRATIGERFGALNLPSSSAREQAYARGLATVSSKVGEEGLRAGVGAAESAAARNLASLQSAGQLYGSAAQGQLAGQTAKAGAGQGLINPLLGSLGQERAYQSAAQPNISYVNPYLPAPRYAPTPPGGPLPDYGYAAGHGGTIPEFAGGGSMPDYLSNLLFGRSFAPPPGPVHYVPYAPPQQAYSGGYGYQGAMGAPQESNVAKQMAMQNPQYFHPRPQGPRSRVGQPYQQAFQYGPAAPQTIGAPTGYTFIPYGASMPGGAFSGFAGGGAVPGVDTGEDYVPALLRGGEGVLTPEMTDRVMGSDSNMPLIHSIQQMLMRKPEYADGMEHHAYGGTNWEDNPTPLGSMGPAVSNITPGQVYSVPSQPPMAPRTPGMEAMAAAQQQYADAQRRLSLINSAMSLGTQGSADRIRESLLPGALAAVELAQKNLGSAQELTGREEYAQAQVQAAQAQETARVQAAQETAKGQEAVAKQKQSTQYKENVVTAMRKPDQFTGKTPTLEQATLAQITPRLQAGAGLPEEAIPQGIAALIQALHGANTREEFETLIQDPTISAAIDQLAPYVQPGSPEYDVLAQVYAHRAQIKTAPKGK